MTGIVIKNTGSWYVVRMDDGQLFSCKVKGNFRLRGIRSTNPVAVGDRVEVKGEGTMMTDERLRVKGEDVMVKGEGGLPTKDIQFRTQNSESSPQNSELVGLITDILPRRNYIIRKATNLSKQSHILAANVDQVMLLVTIAHPETSLTFIDRFLASAEAYRIPVILVFNKTDMYDAAQLQQTEQLMALYQSLDYPCLACSALNGQGIDQLRIPLTDKTTLLSGNSGVGKSTLLNALIPGLNVRTEEISEAHDTGQHTTTFSEMYDLPFGGHLIDTPGIKGFGTFDIDPREASHYFREIFRESEGCHFANCTHTHEPRCAVRQAVEENRIAQSRYTSYLSILEDKDEDRYRKAY